MWNSRSYRKSQSVRLTRPMIGILTANDHLDRIRLNRLQSPQFVARRRVTNARITFDLHRRINGFQHPIGQAQLRSMLLEADQKAWTKMKGASRFSNAASSFVENLSNCLFSGKESTRYFCPFAIVPTAPFATKNHLSLCH